MEDDSISVLREQSRQLDKDVREVESRIRGNRAPQNKGFKRDSQRPAWQAHDDAASKRQRADTAVRPKLMSTIAVVVSPSHGSDRWNPNDEDSVQAAKPAAREVEQRPDNMSRNKRMLGALMGHLNTARKNLENDSTIKVQESIEINVALKNREQIKVAKREEGEKELALRDELLAKQVKNDIALATACWKKNLLQTEGFCVTDTEPRIAWLPGINDGPISRYVDMDKRRKEIEVLVAEREEADAARTREMDEEVVSKKARRQMLRDARDAEHVQAEVKPQEPAAEVDCDLLGQDLSEGHEDEDENEN